MLSVAFFFQIFSVHTLFNLHYMEPAGMWVDHKKIWQSFSLHILQYCSTAEASSLVIPLRALLKVTENLSQVKSSGRPFPVLWGLGSHQSLWVSALPLSFRDISILQEAAGCSWAGTLDHQMSPPQCSYQSWQLCSRSVMLYEYTSQQTQEGHVDQVGSWAELRHQLTQAGCWLLPEF